MDWHVREVREEELDRVVELTMQAFNAPPHARERYRTQPIDRKRLIERGGRLAGALGILPFGHYFGGRAVPSAGISSVAIAPEARGGLAAQTLMQQTLLELRTTYPLSTLYPATMPLYRRCGYEQVAAHTRYKAPLQAMPRRAELGVEPWDDSHLAEIQASYREFATRHNGLMDRQPEWWTTRILVPFEPDASLYRYCVREGGAVTGSIVFKQSSNEGFHFDIDCNDLFYATPAAGRALLALAARHRSLGDNLVWRGPHPDLFDFMLEEYNVESTWRFPMMGRILDVAAAVAARGYAAGIESAFEIEITDPLIEPNDGVWRIEVSAGEGKAAPGSQAQARTTIGGFASLWSGFLRGREAVRAGLLEADDGAIEAIDRAFGGPQGWTLDFF